MRASLGSTACFMAVAVWTLISWASCSYAQAPSFRGLGFVPGFSTSSALDMSSDGKVVVGDRAFPVGAMRWSEATGVMAYIGPFPGGSGITESLGVNKDGSAVVGYDGFGGNCSPNRPWRWTAETGMVFLGFVPGSQSTSAYSVNADGSVVVGMATPCGSLNQAARYTDETGWVALDFLPGGNSSGAYGISADGTVVVGSTGYPDGTFQAFRWTQANGMSGLGFLPGGNISGASRVSADGTTIVGYSNGSGSNNGQAYRWRQATGMMPIGFLLGAINSVATNVNSDGSVIVGESGGKPFRWTASDGMKSIEDLLTAAGVSIKGWQIETARGVSADGTVISGTGVDPSGLRQAWLAKLPLPSTSVSIMIKPPSPPPVPINLGSGGVTPVAILSQTGFNDIDSAAIRLSGAPVKPKPGGGYSCEEKDVNTDNKTDFECHVITDEIDLACGPQKAKLTGSLKGKALHGEEDVIIKGRNCRE
jgi:probable HAF family extracellular repeat protein